MFSILDGMNSWLSYISIEAKTKARIYTVLGFFGWLYMIYITYRFLTNQVWTRGLLMLGATIGLGYFLYLNIIYYFTKKSSKLDITPIVNKTLHIQPKEIKRDGRFRDIPANGLFDERKTMPAKLISSPVEQTAINNLAVQMLEQGLIVADYNNLDNREIKNIIKENDEPVYAIGTGSMIPYFSMKKLNGQYVIYAGINEPHAQPVGKLKTVGFQDISQVDLTNINLYLAAAYLTGGKYKNLGRNGIIEINDDYHISIQVAYDKK